MLCSGKELNVLERFMEGKYSTNKAVRDVLRVYPDLATDFRGRGMRC
jgi:hypothetical protein